MAIPVPLHYHSAHRHDWEGLFPHVSCRSKGKRGGLRVVYLYTPDAFRIDLADVYGKDEKDNLTPAEKKVLAGLAKGAREEAIRAYRESRGEP